MFDAVGMAALRERSVALTAYLEAAIDALVTDAEILTPRDPTARGAQLSVACRMPRARLAAPRGARRRRRLPRTGYRQARTGPLCSTYHDAWRAARALADTTAPPPPPRAPDDQDRLRRDDGAVPPDRPPRLVRPGGGGGLRGRLHGLGAFPPVDPAPGPERLRLGVHGRPRARTSFRFGTAVTCPGFRYHPAVIAHAAATLGAMYPGRFYLGLGAGEALNEHVIAPVWPEVPIRSAMMFEAIEVISKLFSGEVVRHDGKYFTLERAKLYTVPPDDPSVPIYVATAGPINAKKTGKFADGLITVGAADDKMKRIWGKFEEGRSEVGKRRARPQVPPAPHLVGAHRRRGDGERPGRVAQWRHGVLPQAGHQEPRGLRRHRQARPGGGLHEPGADQRRPRGARRHIQHYVDMGYDEIHLHNVGRNQAEFIETFGREVLPNLRLG